MKNSKFLLLDEEKKLLSKTIRKENKKFLRDDYENDKFMNYFWIRFKKIPRIHFQLNGWIYYGFISIFGLFLIVLFNLMLKSMIVNFNYQQLGFIILFLFISGIFSLVSVKPGLNDFNIWKFYFIMFLFLGLAFAFSLLAASLSIGEAGIIGYYLMSLIPMFFAYCRQKRILGAGKLYLHGIALLVDIENPQLWNKYIKNDIQRFIMGWDDWISEALGLRIENYDEIVKNILQEIVFDPLGFTLKMKNVFNQNFFDAIKNWEEREKLKEISSIIRDLSKVKDINFKSDTLILRIRGKSGVIDLFSILIGIIIGVTSFIFSLVTLVIPA